MKLKIGDEVRWRSKKKNQQSGEISSVDRKIVKKHYYHMNWTTKTKQRIDYKATDGWNYDIKWADGTTSTEVSSRKVKSTSPQSRVPKNRQISVPFDVSTGNPVVESDYSGTGGKTAVGYVKKGFVANFPNFEFEANIKFIQSRMWSYSSTVRIFVFNIDSGDLDNTPFLKGSVVAMHHKDFDNMLKTANFSDGVVGGRWTFKKSHGKTLLIRIN